MSIISRARKDEERGRLGDFGEGEETINTIQIHGNEIAALEELNSGL